MSDSLDKLYQKIFKDALDFSDEYEVQMVAATYMAIAMRLYKTSLSDEGFVNMIRTVMETEVEPYDDPKKYLKKFLH